jgi:hypothetical protein
MGSPRLSVHFEALPIFQIAEFFSVCFARYHLVAGQKFEDG